MTPKAQHRTIFEINKMGGGARVTDRLLNQWCWLTSLFVYQPNKNHGAWLHGTCCQWQDNTEVGFFCSPKKHFTVPEVCQREPLKSTALLINKCCGLMKLNFNCWGRTYSITYGVKRALHTNGTPS